MYEREHPLQGVLFLSISLAKEKDRQANLSVFGFLCIERD